MQSDLLVERLQNPEIPAYEVSAQVTQCQNRFEIRALPGREIDTDWALSALIKWLRARVDAQNPGGHNRPTSHE